MHVHTASLYMFWTFNRSVKPDHNLSGTAYEGDMAIITKVILAISLSCLATSYKLIPLAVSDFHHMHVIFHVHLRLVTTDLKTPASYCFSRMYGDTI